MESKSKATIQVSPIIPAMDCRARVRSMLACRFLQSVVERSAGTDYRAERLIDADRTMADYFLWLKSVQSELRG